MSILLSLGSWAEMAQSTQNQPTPVKTGQLLLQFAAKNDSPQFLAALKKNVMVTGVQAVPVLTKVMREGAYSDKKRWLATFSLGRIMGKKSRRFIAKFTRHPHWVMRLAGLKTLLALKDHSSGKFYRDALRDPSLVVRLQALENIRTLNIKEYGQEVWQMIFHKHNYRGGKGQRRRTAIISKAIRVVGELQYSPARGALLKLVQNHKYSDLTADIDYALQKLTGEKSPPKVLKKLLFWKNYKL